MGEARLSECLSRIAQPHPTARPQRASATWRPVPRHLLGAVTSLLNLGGVVMLPRGARLPTQAEHSALVVPFPSSVRATKVTNRGRCICKVTIDLGIRCFLRFLRRIAYGR